MNTSEKGPIYGVTLLDELPLGTGSMTQALPNRHDLVIVSKLNMRVAAGYEVLLAHYRDAIERIEKLK